MNEVAKAVARIAAHAVPALFELIVQAIEGDKEAQRRLADILPGESPDSIERRIDDELAKAKFG